MSISYRVYAGQYVKISIKGVHRFTGIINSTSWKKVDNSVDVVFQTVQCNGLNNLPAKRTIKTDYNKGTSIADIVEESVDTYMVQDGMQKGTITATVTINEDWRDDCITVSDVLDECASRTGCQWFIDKNFSLQFYQDPVTVSSCSYSITSVSTFTDYRDVEVEESIDNYVNKVFLVGGNDERGNQVFVVNGDMSEQNNMQLITAGTGTFGTIHKDGALTESDYTTASVGTTGTSLFFPFVHGLQVGDMFWNQTRGAYAWVTVVPTTGSVVHTRITGQVEGDTIVFYDDVNAIGRNTLKRQDKIPQVVKFSTYKTDFEPQEKIHIVLTDMGINGYYNIDNVQINDIGGRYFKSVINCILRNNEDFSTQRCSDFTDYFRGL
jgi:hypothetical protein